MNPLIHSAFFKQFTPDQIKAQYKRNLTQLEWMHKRALEKGEYNGFSPEDLEAKIDAYKELSK